MELNVSIMENRSRHHFHQPQVNACLSSVCEYYSYLHLLLPKISKDNSLQITLYLFSNAFKLDNDLVS